ncbi:hypothetical protein N9815_00270 [Flavobacteriales bacterium]|nr:hypothetical protein [Flavobacteriales bacterium]
MKSKYIIILLLSVIIFSSCRTKKTFNGTATLPCSDYEESSKTKKKSKWKLVLYKDGEKLGGKSKKGKSRLFKKSN